MFRALLNARAVSGHSPPVLRARSVTEMLVRYAAVGTGDRLFFLITFDNINCVIFASQRNCGAFFAA